MGVIWSCWEHTKNTSYLPAACSNEDFYGVNANDSYIFIKLSLEENTL